MQTSAKYRGEQKPQEALSVYSCVVSTEFIGIHCRQQLTKLRTYYRNTVYSLQ